MLMHTKVASNYDGPEEIMSRTPCYTEINVTSNYAPTSRVEIVVVDSNGNPVPNATVEFKLYNYAEFYTVANKVTDASGCTFLTAGRGDLLVWVTKEDLVAVKKVTWNHDKRETIILKSKSLPQHLDIDIVPPVANTVIPKVSDEQRVLNDRRKAQEDSIRQAYEASMPVEAWRGNHKTINQFIIEAKNKVMAHKLLEMLSSKDLRDINLDVLKDNEVVNTDTNDIYCHYVLCPRVENEWLTPYKAFFRKEFSNKISNINDLIEWTRENITIDNEHNPQRLRQQPISVYRTQHTDDLGRDIFFVSAARSLGWPTRINEVNSKLEYYCNNFWHKVIFDREFNQTEKPIGTLRLNLVPTNEHNDLTYYTHFTLSKIVGNKAQLFTFPEDATWRNSFKDGVTLETGTYLLTTGNRQSDGSVLASTTTFEINDGKETVVNLEVREEKKEYQVIGKLLNTFYYSNGERRQLLEGDGFHIVGIIAPSNEPTTHALHDIATCGSQLEDLGSNIILLTQNDEQNERLDRMQFSDLPVSVTWGVDKDKLVDKDKFVYGVISTNIKQATKANKRIIPLFVVTDNEGNIFFSHQGYTIHLGEQILKAIIRHKEIQKYSGKYSGN